VLTTSTNLSKHHERKKSVPITPTSHSNHHDRKKSVLTTSTNLSKHHERKQSAPTTSTSHSEHHERKKSVPITPTSHGEHHDRKKSVLTTSTNLGKHHERKKSVPTTPTTPTAQSMSTILTENGNHKISTIPVATVMSKPSKIMEITPTIFEPWYTFIGEGYRPSRLLYKQLQCEIPISKLRYNLTKCVLSVICNVGGTVFGGAVRDMILHHHAHAWFIKDMEAHGRKHEASSKNYSNPVFHSVTKDRLLCPRDIDCVLTSQQLSHLSAVLKGKHYRFHPIKQNHHYQGEFAVSTYVVQPIAPVPLRHFFRGLSVHIDVLEPAQWAIVEVDYECNGLVMSGAAMTPSLSPMLFEHLNENMAMCGEKLASITSDIIHRKAVELKHVARRRRKMIDIGFEIHDLIGNLVNISSLSPCGICQKETSFFTYVNKRCCDTMFHSSCVQKQKFNTLDNDMVFEKLELLDCKCQQTTN
jgi:hypothetical protein